MDSGTYALGVVERKPFGLLLGLYQICLCHIQYLASLPQVGREALSRWRWQLNEMG